MSELRDLRDLGIKRIPVDVIRFKTVSDITGSLKVGGSVFITSSISSSFGNIHTLSGSTLRINKIISNKIETNQVSGSTLTFNTVNFHAMSGSRSRVHDMTFHVMSGSQATLHDTSFYVMSGSKSTVHNMSFHVISGSKATIHDMSSHIISGSQATLHDTSFHVMSGSKATIHNVSLHTVSGSRATIHNMSSSTMTINELQTDSIIARDIRTTSSIATSYAESLNSFTEHDDNDSQNTYFGLSLAMKDANTVYVGAYGDSNDQQPGHGALYKFDYTPSSPDADGAVWVQDTNFKLSASDLGKGLELAATTDYGKSVATMGSYIAVGAPNQTLGGRSSVGKVYIVKEDEDAEMRGDGNAFKTEKVLVVSGSAGDNFGKVLAMSNSGRSLAIGVPDSGSSGTINKGRVFVYRSGTIADDWRLEATLDPSDGANYDYFGSSLSFSGSYLAIGSPAHNPAHPTHGGTVDQAGAVYIYNSSSASGWGVVTKLTSSHVLTAANYGRSVALIDDNRIVVGEPEGWNHNYLGYTGSVHIEKFYETGTNRQKNLQVLRNNVSGQNNYYGAFVASSGSGQYIAVSRPVGGDDTSNDSTSAEGNRAVLYYASGAASWSLNQTFTRNTTLATYYGSRPGAWIKNHITPFANPWTPLDMVGTTVIHGIPGASDSNFHSTDGLYGYNYGEFRVWQLVETGASSGTISGSTAQFHHLTASRITTTGKVGVKNTSPTYTLDVTGDINASGDVRSAGSALSSDLRLKENVVSLEPTLNTVSLLNPVRFDWKDGSRTGNLNSDKYRLNDIGFIAQELSGAFPSLVSEGMGKDKILGINYSKMVTVLARAIQELNKRVIHLENVISGSKK